MSRRYGTAVLLLTAVAALLTAAAACSDEEETTPTATPRGTATPGGAATNTPCRRSVRDSAGHGHRPREELRSGAGDGQGHHPHQAPAGHRAADGEQLRLPGAARATSMASPSTASCPASWPRAATPRAPDAAGPATTCRTNSATAPSTRASWPWPTPASPTAVAASSSSPTPARRDLDGKYTVFGEVIEGMDVAEKLTPRDPDQNPNAPPGDRMIKVTIEEQ